MKVLLLKKGLYCTKSLIEWCRITQDGCAHRSFNGRLVPSTHIDIGYQTYIPYLFLFAEMRKEKLLALRI